jgi:DNA-binding response OmpR family regulator
MMKKVLIVEDEVICALYLKVELARHGFNVLKPVGSGEKALGVARENNPDVLIMDIHLSGKVDGIQTAKEIKSFSDPQVVFITGFADDEMKNRAREVESSIFLTKPVNVEQVLRVL